MLGVFRFDPASGALSAPNGRVVTLRGQCSQVLEFLARHAGEVVNRQALVDAIWGDTFVTDDSLIQCISEIRKAIGDKDRSIVQTFPKKGYCLVPTGTKAMGETEIQSDADLALRPRIAVLAFDDLSNGPDRGFLSDAIAEAITAELSSFGEFSVVARNSSFRFRGTATDVRVIGAELGALYVLEGSQQKDGDRLRVVARLIDARSGKHIWAETFERAPDDLFVTQSEIAAMISATVGFQVAYRPPRSGGLGEFSALRYHLQAREHMHQATRASLEKAEALNLKAIEVEPMSPYGHIGMAFVNHHKCINRWHDCDLDDALERARTYSDKALELAPQNYSCHFVSGSVHRLAGELERARQRFERAMELNPAAMNVRMVFSQVLSLLGRIDESVATADHVMRENPSHAEWYYTVNAAVLFRAGEYQRAMDMLAKMARIPIIDQLLIAAIHARLGHENKAREGIGRYLKENPDHTVTAEREFEERKYPHPAMLENWLDALRLAGLPEG